MFLRVQVLAWGGTAALALLGLAWEDVEQAQRLFVVAGGIAAAAVLLFFAWPAAGAPSDEEARAALLEERSLCSRCLQPNRIDRVRCRRCIAPISWRSTFLAFESDVTEGWTLGALGREPHPDLRLLLAAWFLYPAQIAGWSVWAFALSFASGGGFPAMLVPALVVLATVSVGMTILFLACLANVTRNFVRRRRPKVASLEADPGDSPA